MTLALLYIAGSTLRVRLTAGEWVQMTGRILIGLIPFAVLGILIGHLLTADSVGPAIGGIVAVFAILGGTWFPVSGVMHAIAEGLPSFWLVQASHVALGGNAWSRTGWLVIACWTVVLAALARWAYRRDTKRT